MSKVKKDLIKSFALSGFIAIPLTWALGSGFFNAWSSMSIETQGRIIFISISLAVTLGSTFWLLTKVNDRDTLVTPLLLVVLSETVIFLLELSHTSAHINDRSFFVAFAAVAIFSIYFKSKIISSVMASLPEVSKFMAVASSTLLLTFSSALYFALNWMPTSQANLYIRAMEIGLLLSIPWILGIMRIASNKSGARRQAIATYYSQVFQQEDLQKFCLLSTQLVCVIEASLVMLQLAGDLPIDIQSMLPLSGFHFWFLVGSIFVLQLSKQGLINSYFVELTNRLASSSARRFLRRSLESTSNQESYSVSVRTACFQIDHDPDQAFKDRYTYTLCEIRSFEFVRALQELFGNRLLTIQVSGSKIFGCLDPEISARPSTDAFAGMQNLQVELVPMIRERFRVLSRILPVTDPTLAKKIANQIDVDQNSKFGENIEIILDYDWVDQVLIFQKTGPYYHIAKGTSFEELDKSPINKKTRDGCDISISSRYLERIGVEHPRSLNELQNFHKKPNTANSNEVFNRVDAIVTQSLEFIDMKTQLGSLAIRPESQRLIRQINAQLRASPSLNQIAKLIKAIEQYQWHGFKEKDSALETSVQLYEQGLKNISDAADIEKFRTVFAKLLAAIGYPGSGLHIGQLRKLELRRTDFLLTYAKNPNDRRFGEALLMLASIDAKGLSENERHLSLQWLSDVTRTLGKQKNHYLNIKSVEILSNLAVSANLSDLQILNSCLENLALILLNPKTQDARSLSFLLEVYSFLNNKFEGAITWGARAQTLWDKYFATKYNRVRIQLDEGDTSKSNLDQKSKAS